MKLLDCSKLSLLQKYLYAFTSRPCHVLLPYDVNVT